MRGATGLVDAEFKGQAFQSTRPMRGATIMDWFGDTFFIISIHAPHAGRDNDSQVILALHLISIHAPHAGRDIMDWFGDTFFIISIHAPHAGRDREGCPSK